MTLMYHYDTTRVSHGRDRLWAKKSRRGVENSPSIAKNGKMDGWIRFDTALPEQGQFIATITQRDANLPIELWEADLERNAIGIWVDGVVWEGDVPLSGFTHWLGLPDRPTSAPPSGQLQLWELWRDDNSHNRQG